MDNIVITIARQYGSGGKTIGAMLARDLGINCYSREILKMASEESGINERLFGMSDEKVRHAPWFRLLSRPYDGELLTPKRAEKLRGKEIALIPQGVTWLDPLMKVGAQLRKGRNDAETKEKCRQALRRYGLGEDTEELYPFELSGGMARRVLIASAVIEKPRLIIADEPTPGLDARAAARILGHFRELAEEGAGVLFITHDLELALTVADRVAVFYAGETIEEADAADFSDEARLRHPFTRALWNAVPSRKFRPIPGAQPYPGTVSEGCPFAGQCGKCRAECRRAENIPLEPFEGGMVRCLYPEKGVEL